MTITFTPAPPVTPPCVGTICLDKPGTVTLQWTPASSGGPSTLTFTEGDLCTKLYISEDCIALLATSPGSKDLKIV